MMQNSDLCLLQVWRISYHPWVILENSVKELMLLSLSSLKFKSKTFIGNTQAFVENQQNSMAHSIWHHRNHQIFQKFRAEFRKWTFAMFTKRCFVLFRSIWNSMLLLLFACKEPCCRQKLQNVAFHCKT